jgi:hypothetical protein
VNSANVNHVSCQVTHKVREVIWKVEKDFIMVLAWWVVGIQTTRDISWDTAISMRDLRERVVCSSQRRDTEHRIE